LIVRKVVGTSSANAHRQCPNAVKQRQQSGRLQLRRAICRHIRHLLNRHRGADLNRATANPTGTSQTPSQILRPIWARGQARSQARHDPCTPSRPAYACANRSLALDVAFEVAHRSGAPGLCAFAGRCSTRFASLSIVATMNKTAAKSLNVDHAGELIGMRSMRDG